MPVIGLTVHLGFKRSPSKDTFLSALTHRDHAGGRPKMMLKTYPRFFCSWTANGGSWLSPGWDHSISSSAQLWDTQRVRVSLWERMVLHSPCRVCCIMLHSKFFFCHQATVMSFKRLGVRDWILPLTVSVISCCRQWPARSTQGRCLEEKNTSGGDFRGEKNQNNTTLLV